MLNGAGTDGLASSFAETLASRGFSAVADDAAYLYDYTFLVYNGDDAEAKARAVAEVIGGNPEIIANDGSYPIDANVVLVLGLDQVG